MACSNRAGTMLFLQLQLLPVDRTALAGWARRIQTLANVSFETDIGRWKSPHARELLAMPARPATHTAHPYFAVDPIAAIAPVQAPHLVPPLKSISATYSPVRATAPPLSKGQSAG